MTIILTHAKSHWFARVGCILGFFLQLIFDLCQNDDDDNNNNNNNNLTHVYDHLMRLIIFALRMDNVII
jgi:hypothetical protein